MKKIRLPPLTQFAMFLEASVPTECLGAGYYYYYYYHYHLLFTLKKKTKKTSVSLLAHFFGGNCACQMFQTELIQDKSRDVI